MTVLRLVLVAAAAWNAGAGDWRNAVIVAAVLGLCEAERVARRARQRRRRERWDSIARTSRL